MIHRQKIRTLLVVALGIVMLMAVTSGCSKKPSPLLKPDLLELSASAPEVFRVQFETSEGNFVIEAHRSWSPIGVDRLYHLVKNNFYDDARFFRVIKGFMVQFGYHGDPLVIKAWSNMTIADDPVVQSNLRGYVSYAKSNMPNSRSTQLFINYRDNPYLDRSGFSPIGRVIEGMDVVDKLYGGYGEGAPGGAGPSQEDIQLGGNAYLTANFPDLDYIIKTTLLSVELPK
ncbi:MAG: peptidylprolyl isomerase [Candidatus Zhuqueibacterota bacterium]